MTVKLQRTIFSDSRTEIRVPPEFSNHHRHHMYGPPLCHITPLPDYPSWNQRAYSKPIVSGVVSAATNDISPHKRTYGTGMLM